jgi:hypothetical protein
MPSCVLNTKSRPERACFFSPSSLTKPAHQLADPQKLCPTRRRPVVPPTIPWSSAIQIPYTERFPGGLVHCTFSSFRRPGDIPSPTSPRRLTDENLNSRGFDPRLPLHLFYNLASPTSSWFTSFTSKSGFCWRFSLVIPDVSQSTLQLRYGFTPTLQVAFDVRIDGDSDRVPALVGSPFRSTPSLWPRLA